MAISPLVSYFFVVFETTSFKNCKFFAHSSYFITKVQKTILNYVKVQLTSNISSKLFNWSFFWDWENIFSKYWVLFWHFPYMMSKFDRLGIWKIRHKWVAFHVILVGWESLRLKRFHSTSIRFYQNIRVIFSILAFFVQFLNQIYQFQGKARNV